jgi:hypothetical protein
MYYFNSTSGQWKKYRSELPRLMYHSMTEGPQGTFYVYGGGSSSGSFSNSLYKFSGERPGTWELVSSSCCGKVKDRTVLGHSMNYWPSRNVLVLFGGLVSDVARFSKLSTLLWLFLINSNTWIPIEYRRPGTEGNTERAFHTAHIFSDRYLLVLGGVSGKICIMLQYVLYGYPVKDNICMYVYLLVS